ncbi:MAG TPA: hypothetical protein VNN62_04075 [Methylomirabilota bacterium]|jgi:urease accessory protein|nr:hypothetical protein [Methylomirabilota bacterium]
MQHLSHRVGNVHLQPDIAAQAARWRAEDCLDEATIEERQTGKSRLRLRTQRGREVGLILPRGLTLADGDVFAVENERGGVLLHVAPQEVMVLTPLDSREDPARFSWLVRLGHVLGNQHWPVVVTGEQILTPVTVDRAVMETVLKTHHLTDHFSIHYEQRSWPKEAGSGGAWTTHHS